MDREAVVVASGGFVLVVLLVVAGMFGIPAWSVWQQGKRGEGELHRAQQNKQVLIEQAKAEVEAAKLRAEAIEIVGEASQKFPEYRTQEFIGAFAEAMQNGTIQKIIYVPTEANIPIVSRPGD